MGTGCEEPSTTGVALDSGPEAVVGISAVTASLAVRLRDPGESIPLVWSQMASATS